MLYYFVVIIIIIIIIIIIYVVVYIGLEVFTFIIICMLAAPAGAVCV